MAGPVWPALPRREIGVAPNPGLKPHVHLADVVQGGKDAQARRRCVVQGVQAAGTGQPLADGGLLQQRLHTGSYVGQVIVQQVDAPGVGSVRLGPMVAGVGREILGNNHISCPLFVELPEEEETVAGV